MKYLALLFLILFLRIGFSQNLILNGEFICHPKTQSLRETRVKIDNWMDIFGIELSATNGFSTLNSKLKIQDNGYVNFFVFDLSSPQKRNYVQTSLEYVLEKGRQYDISFDILFNVNYAWKDMANINVFGFSFADTCIISPKPKVLKNIQPAFQIMYFNELNQAKKVMIRQDWDKNYSGKYGSDTSITNLAKKWTTFRGTYTAKGNEKYIVLGNFCPDEIYMIALKNILFKGKNNLSDFTMIVSVDNIIVSLKRNTRN
jgi:hypothetical protein